MSDLIERLRADKMERVAELCDEAADEIEQLQIAEQDALDINEQLQAENERLRELLLAQKDRTGEFLNRCAKLEKVLADFPTIAKSNADLIRRIKEWLPERNKAIATAEEQDDE